LPCVASLGRGVEDRLGEDFAAAASEFKARSKLMTDTSKKAFRLLTVNGDQQEYICPLRLETGRHTSM